MCTMHLERLLALSDEESKPFSPQNLILYYFGVVFRSPGLTCLTVLLAISCRKESAYRNLQQLEQLARLTNANDDSQNRDG